MGVAEGWWGFEVGGWVSVLVGELGVVGWESVFHCVIMYISFSYFMYIHMYRRSLEFWTLS